MGIRHVLSFVSSYNTHDDVVKHFQRYWPFIGLLCGEFTGHQWPVTKASDAELRWLCSLDALHAIILTIEESTVRYINGLILKCWGRNILAKLGQYIVFNALAICDNRPSADTVSTMWAKCFPYLPRRRIALICVISFFWEMIENTKEFSCFLKLIQHVEA